MINQLKLLIVFNRYKWVYAGLFIATIAFDIFLFVIRNDEVSAFSPYNMTFYIMLMFALSVFRYSINSTRSREIYYLQNIEKKKLIINEWRLILIFNLISFLFWSLELILSKMTISMLPLLYVYSISIVLNALIIFCYYMNNKYYHKVIKAIFPLLYIGIIFIFTNLQFDYVKNNDIVKQPLFSILPFITLILSYIIGKLFIQNTIKKSHSKHLLWSD
ncbi:hypothetical protein BHU61_03700 [Macrococcus epidermidis]|uniref:Uncharacterized protein n=1 Tax=Macrococcus epidermidis TaxID=1902580 RepID=A0A327ZW39_9STAP|nr:hypothetical protein BHU61_03700 [Macrococcus epidermidis]